LNVTPGDILLYNNQIYVTDTFLAQYSQALLITAVTCLFIGFGLARCMDDIIVPYFRAKIQAKENDYGAL
jgi:fucose permease